MVTGLPPAEAPGTWAALEAALLERRPRQKAAQDLSPNSLSIPLQKEGVGRLLSSTPMIDPGYSQMRGPAVWNVLCLSGMGLTTDRETEAGSGGGHGLVSRVGGAFISA